MENICELLNELQELTLKLEKSKTLDDIKFYDRRISYVRNKIIEKTIEKKD